MAVVSGIRQLVSVCQGHWESPCSHAVAGPRKSLVHVLHEKAPTSADSVCQSPHSVARSQDRMFSLKWIHIDSHGLRPACIVPDCTCFSDAVNANLLVLPDRCVVTHSRETGQQRLAGRRHSMGQCNALHFWQKTTSFSLNAIYCRGLLDSLCQRKAGNANSNCWGLCMLSCVPSHFWESSSGGETTEAL